MQKENKQALQNFQPSVWARENTRNATHTALLHTAYTLDGGKSGSGDSPTTPIASVTPANSDAADTAKSTDKPLTGLSGVAVIVEKVRADAKADGLDINKIKSDTEASLRNAGIKVFETSVSVGNLTLAYLYINVNTIKPVGFALYSYSIDVKVYENVRLYRDVPVITNGSTWDIGKVGIAQTKDMVNSINQSIVDDVDQFISAYSEQNPK